MATISFSKTLTGANQNARKLLSTDLVNTKSQYSFTYKYVVTNKYHYAENKMVARRPPQPHS